MEVKKVILEINILILLTLKIRKKVCKNGKEKKSKLYTRFLYFDFFIIYKDHVEIVLQPEHSLQCIHGNTTSPTYLLLHIDLF